MRGSGPKRGKRPGRRPPTGGPEERHRGPGDPARDVAFDVLRAVDERDAYANLLLPRMLRDRRLSTRDAGLATELAYGTLRNRGTYDEIIAVCGDRPLKQVDPALLDALRLGAHQLLRTRIPPHAAVSATVALVRRRVGTGPSRFANAVLRKIADRGLEDWLEVITPEDPVRRLAVVHSHPRWIVSAFRDALGGSLSETERLLAADNEPPGVTLVARPGRATVEELDAEPARYSPYGAYLAEGDPGNIPAVRDGRAAVQDEASQMCALALSRVPLEEDAAWLDLCAGPGGKAGLLAALADARGARLVASELRPHRARLVHNAGVSGAIVADATAGAWRPGTFDRVIADVPCTGLGALRRRPEARWRRTPSSIPELTALQRSLLTAATEAVRPGGVVAYVTCSPHLAETRVVVDDVAPDWERLDAREYLPEVDDLGDGPFAQFWPHRHGTDAMFLALLRRP